MSTRLPSCFDITIERVVFEGDGLAHYAEQPNTKARPIFVAGVFPGETVRVAPTRVTSKFAKARLVQVLKSDPARREPRDPSHLSTSPWQTAPEEIQLNWKRDTTLDMWRHATGGLPTESVEIVTSPLAWGYRNKLEYSVVGQTGALSLGFRERGRWNAFVTCPTGTALAPKQMNDVACTIVAELNRQQLPANSVKSLLVRHSFSDQKTIAVLYLNTPNIKPFALPANLASGWRIVYSDPARSESIETKILYHEGSLDLTEEIAGTPLTYGHQSFFQVNPPAFTELIKYLRTELETKENLIDLYSGVGTIGFALGEKFRHIISVESNHEAVQYARQNAKQLELNAEINDGLVEKQALAKILSRSNTVIVDPPRAGLHADAVEQILNACPATLVYVSCNPATQARDFVRLREKYAVSSWRLFDFYPQTPHLESVLILKKK
jgi:23S rRNA (uracil1939-C5)-methyltransferase